MIDLRFPDILLDSLENGHMIIDDNFIVTYWNRWLAINTQISKEQILNKSLQEFYPELNYAVLKRKIKTALLLKTPSFYDVNSSIKFIPIDRQKITTSSVKLMQQQVTISPYIIEQRKVMISIYDVSELFETKISLQRINNTLLADKEIIDHNIMTMKSDKDGTILDVSSLFCKFFGYKKDDLIGKKASVLKSGNMPQHTYKELWKTINSKMSWCGEMQNKTLENGSKWVQSRITPILDEKGNILEFSAVYHDITNEKLLEQLYITDPLTQLHNRTYFDKIMHLIEKHQREEDVNFILVLSDIDHFKSINDKYGHQVGDEALKTVANILKDSLRDSDEIARWGGEEFIIMLKNVTIDESLMICEKLRYNVNMCNFKENMVLSCSFGVSKYVLGENINTLFKRADDALYEAKNSGRNKVVLKS